MRCFALLKR